MAKVYLYAFSFLFYYWIDVSPEEMFSPEEMILLPLNTQIYTSYLLIYLFVFIKILFRWDGTVKVNKNKQNHYCDL